MLAGELHRCALEQAELVFAGELAERNHGTGESDRTDEGTNEEFDTVAHRDGIANVGNDTESLGLGHCSDCDTDRCQTDQRMHRGDQFRHLGHFDALGEDGAYATTDDHAEDQQAEAGRRSTGSDGFALQLGDQRNRSEHGDGHAGHAEGIAATGRSRMRQTLERLNEADRGDQVEKGNDVHAHDFMLPLSWPSALFS